MKRILALSILLFLNVLHAQIGGPRQVDAETIALWNFDSNTNEIVIDIATSPLEGEIFGASRQVVPEISMEFGSGVLFGQESHFVDFGTTRSSKLDFKGKDSFSIEAIIRLSSSAPDSHIIYANDQVQLMVLGNKLGGFIRLPGGFRGVVGEEQLSLNTNYRVSMVKVGSTVAIAINDQVINSVVLDGEITDTSFPEARITIGGDIFGQYFPGYIDDVRLSNGSVLDIVKPEVELIKPDSFVVNNERPYFEFALSDNDTGIDSSSVKVFLNSVLQNNLNIDQATISGYMDDSLLSTQLNEVVVRASDNAGNSIEKLFTLSFTQIGGTTEYENDEFTLGLWHMDDFALAIMTDSSSWGNHGYGDPRYLGIGDGIFGKGRFFNGNSNSFITISSIQVPSKALTFESWINPSSNNTTEEIIFESGQIKVARFNNGQVRIVFYETQGLQVFESEQDLLPVGELKHLAITWDGAKKEKNLNLYIDGGIASSFDACISCDLNPIPQVGIIGKNFNGLMDEMRFSSVVRTGFNIPNNNSRNIEFLNLANGSSTFEAFPEIHIQLNADSGIDPQNVTIKLNGDVQSPGLDLMVTENSIDGIFNTASKLGINYIEISFIDNDGVQKKKTEFFFRVSKLAPGYYETDANTIALYHFDRFSELVDSSGNNHTLSGSYTTGTGVVGESISGSMTVSEMLMSGRSFTIEGHLKIKSLNPNMQRVFALDGDAFDFDLRLNGETKDMNLSLTTPDMSVNKTIQNVFPSDDKFHHVAVIYDSARGHAQLLLLIDGVVRQVINLERSCDFNSPLDLSIGTSHVEFDEVRLLNIPKYEFKISDGLATPEVSYSGVSEQHTITSPEPSVAITLTSVNSISSEGSEIYLNGSKVNTLDFIQSGNSATFQGILENLIDGANILEVFAKDMLGGQSKSTILFYHFRSGGKTPYISDSDTHLLLHFDELDGNQFFDSSDNSHEITFTSGWSLGNDGVFGSSASTWSTTISSDIGSLSGLASYTFELWKKDDYTTLSARLFEYDLSFYQSSGAITFRNPKGSNFSAPNIVIPDGLFHHYALVVDADHPYRQVYILRDGVVIGSTDQFSDEQLTIDDAGSFKFGGSFFNDPVDEMRISTKARYELNY